MPTAKPTALPTASTTALPSVSQETAELAAQSISPNTVRAYQGALRRLTKTTGLPLDALSDAALADYIASLHQAGKAPATCALPIAAVRFASRLAGLPNPIGAITRQTMAGIRRTASDRGRGQARPVAYAAACRMQAVASVPRKRGRGQESAELAAARGTVDCALIGLAFQAGLRRSEIAALTWKDIAESDLPGGLRILVRTSKTNQEGNATDIRLVKDATAAALASLRDCPAASEGRIFGLTARQINRRLQAAAKAAGIEGISAHSFRVGLASELTRLGASTTETMLAGGWKTSRMVAHYSAGAKADRGAIAKYL